MQRATGGGPLHHHPTRWWALAAVLAVLGVGFLVIGLQDHRHPLAAPAPTHQKARSAKASPPTIVSTGIPRSVPVALSIPAIGVTTPLSTLGLNPDGTVEVPTDFQEAGWYRLGPSPGQAGSAVILGHVDSYQGPAVFFRLRALVAGNQIDVTLADGESVRFEVTSVETYSKQAFPAQLVYGSHGDAALQLVTCGGAFDAQTGSYLSNVVVFSSLVGVVPNLDGK
jgi:sortase (surface protein transpeptidase)